mgnify:CR=1 FL=1
MAFNDYIKDPGLTGAMILTGTNPDGTKIPGPASITSGVKNVTTSGTRVALGASAVLTSGVTVKAKATNSGLIYVGGSTVASSNGFQLAAGEEVFVEVGNVATVYVDAAVNGEGVTYIGS